MDGHEPRKKEGAKPEFNDPGRLGRLKEQMYSRASQPQSRPRRTLSGVSRTTADDWQESAADEQKAQNTKSRFSVLTPPKVNVNPKKFSPIVLVLIAAVVVFVIASGVALTLFLSGSNVVTSRNIDISINGPRTIAGGDILELQIAVQNNNSAALELADLIVTYPPGTRVPADPNTALETQRIPLGSIESGGTRTGTVRGIFFGPDGGRQSVHVALEYRLSGSSALFVAEAEHSVLVSSGTLEIALDGNAQAVAGQTIDFTATVTSRAKTPISNVVMSAQYPFGFVENATNPQRSSSGLWELGTLQPGESRTVRILGALDGQTGDTRVFSFTAGTKNTTNSKSVDVVLAQFEQSLTVTRPFLGMTLSYDGKPIDEYTAQTGKPIPITLKWRNNLNVPLSDVVIAATVSGSGLDPFNITADQGFFRSIDSVVLWDKTTTEGRLARVAAGAEGQFVIRLVPSAGQRLAGVQNPVINIELHAAGQRLAEAQVPETIQATVKETLKLQTNASFTGRALYFENPLGSVGPLPPKVEYETTYGVLWEVQNTTNLIRDAVVTATLPPYVRWVGTVSPAAEHVTFNENTGQITWRLGNVLPQTGSGASEPRRVVFSIGFVPSASQVGQKPALIQNQTFTGLDAFTETTVRASFNNLTTLLTEADFAAVYGEVAP